MNRLVPVPTLSTQGWVYDSEKRFDALLAHFFLVEPKRRNLTREAVRSAQTQFQLGGHQPESVAYWLQDALLAYLNPYYTELSVAAVVLDDPSHPARKQVKITVGFREPQGVQSRERFYVLKDGAVERIVRANNG